MLLENLPEKNQPEEINPENGLSAKQERFCLEYLKDLNATAAAKRAGYTDKGAKGSGSRILALWPAQVFIKAERERINSKLREAAEVINNELMDLTFLPRGEFLDGDGDLKNPLELPENLRSAVQIQTKKIKRGDDVTTVTTYSLCNKIQMLEKFSNRLSRQKPAPETSLTEPSNLALLPDGRVRQI